MIINHLELTNGLIHHARNDQYFSAASPGAWPLFLTFRFNGEALYETAEGRFRVDDHAYLLLNAGRAYQFASYSPTTVESLSLGFWPHFVQDVRRTLKLPLDHLLADPVGVDNQSLEFFEKTYRHDPKLLAAVNALRLALDHSAGLERGWLEEQLCQIFTMLVGIQANLRPEIEQIPALKASTRLELYRRLSLAQDYMAANLAEDLSLTDTAAVAGFSSYHFLRVFKQAFGTTPHQYLVDQRLARAGRLLTETDEPVTQICLQVGFASLGSFSTRFQRRFGLSPLAYRRQQRR